MIEVRRQGWDGNLMEERGPVLWVEFGETVTRAVFRQTFLEFRYMNLKHGPIYGYGSEDKFNIRPVASEAVEAGVARNVGIEMDPGGDIYLELSQNAARGLTFDSELPTFEIAEISRNPQGFLDRGMDTLILPTLWVIEKERLSREQFGRSGVDDKWERQHRSGRW